MVTMVTHTFYFAVVNNKPIKSLHLYQISPFVKKQTNQISPFVSNFSICKKQTNQISPIVKNKSIK